MVAIVVKMLLVLSVAMGAAMVVFERLVSACRFLNKVFALMLGTNLMMMTMGIEDFDEMIMTLMIIMMMIL